MLSVQSVNFRPAFGTYDLRYGEVKDVDYELVDDMPSDEYYSKENYSKDKTKLEEHLDEINSVIENTEVPKPVRALGKIASVGIGAALGFVSMKYGAQGVAKLVKKAAAWTKSLGDKKVVKNISEHSKQIIGNLRESKLGKNTAVLFENLEKKYKDTKLSKQLTNINNSIKENKFYQAAMEKGIQVKEKAAKWATAKNLENGIVNLFAVSGGVTGGVTALQEVTKD